MTLDPSVWVFAFAWFMAGLINGLSGMGAAMLALPIAATAMPPSFSFRPPASWCSLFP